MHLQVMLTVTQPNMQSVPSRSHAGCALLTCLFAYAVLYTQEEGFAQCSKLRHSAVDSDADMGGKGLRLFSVPACVSVTVVTMLTCKQWLLVTCWGLGGGGGRLPLVSVPICVKLVVILMLIAVRRQWLFGQHTCWGVHSAM